MPPDRSGRSRPLLVIGHVLVTLVMILLPPATVRADVVVLKDGTMHSGEVQRRTSTELVFRTKVDGTWTDLTFNLAKVDQLFEDAGNQADASPSRETDEPARVPTRERARIDPAPSRRTLAPRPDRRRPAIAVIPLHGQVGGLVEGTVSETFDVSLLEHCLDTAQRDGVEVVLLDIRSPGGYLIEMESICEAIIMRRDDVRIVALAHEALSAAAVIALTCPELLVSPNARVGAAVMVQGSPDGMTAVDAKMASPHHARQRQYMAESGRPYEVVAAMSIQETQLWWSPTAGFTTDAGTAQAADFRLVDGESTVLTMIAEDAVTWGLATATARDARDAIEALGLDAQTQVLDYQSVVDAYNADLDRKLGAVRRDFRSYFQSLGRMNDVLGQLESAVRHSDRAGARDLTSELRRLLRRINTAAGSVRSQDRRLLARRADIPDALIDQFDRDEVLLDEISRLVREQSPSAVRQARGASQTVLEAWRQLLSLPE